LFISNELNCTVTAASFDIETGALTEVCSVFALRCGVDEPDRSHHRGGSDIGLHPNGRFLYVGCRSPSPGILAILEVQGAGVDATLKLLGHESTRGEVPRNFKLLQDGNFLVVGNQATKTVVCYKVDKDSGHLMFASELDTHPYKPCNIASEEAIFA
jgi:6-phosphogluconolactonase